MGRSAPSLRTVVKIFLTRSETSYNVYTLSTPWFGWVKIDIDAQDIRRHPGSTRRRMTPSEKAAPCAHGDAPRVVPPPVLGQAVPGAVEYAWE